MCSALASCLLHLVFHDRNVRATLREALMQKRASTGRAKPSRLAARRASDKTPGPQPREGRASARPRFRGQADACHRRQYRQYRGSRTRTSASSPIANHKCKITKFTWRSWRLGGSSPLCGSPVTPRSGVTWTARPTSRLPYREPVPVRRGGWFGTGAGQ